MAWYQNIGSMFGFGIAGRVNKGYQKASAGSTGSLSNVTIDMDNSLTVSAVWAATKLIAESIGSLPVKGFKIDSKGVRTAAPEHPLAQLFAGKVNRYQTANEFFETMELDECLHGNAYALITRANDSRITSLMPLPADQMTVVLDDTGSLQYRYYQDGALTVISQEKIWHLKGMGNGITGLAPLTYGRESIGLGLAADRRAAKFAKNGFKGTAVLKIDKMLKPEQREAIRTEFSDLALSDDDGLRILEAGLDYQQISMSPADSQLLESRKYQISDIARYFGVPSVLINNNDGASVWGAGVESIVEGFYRFSLRPRLERIEASINCNLLTAAERGRWEFEFSLDSLMRLNPTANATRIKEHVQGGLITPNEGRVMQGMEKSADPNADVLYMQAQMVKLGTPAISKPVAIPSN
jgi:HK97 family phage portal protein